MTIDEKYSYNKDLFYRYYVSTSKDHMYNQRGLYIPAGEVRFSSKSLQEKKSEEVIVGDGTINLASYIQWLFFRYLNGEDVVIELSQALDTLTRLTSSFFVYMKENNPNVYMKKEDGFFVRDDISSNMTDFFHTKKIRSGWSTGIERIEEDPCFSPFVSQDQIWNLLPILSILNGMKGQDDKFRYIAHDATLIMEQMLSYVIENGHTIYNPYYSALKHNWTYLNLRVPYMQRVKERNDKLKYDVKVKRGANNWYYAYGFRKTYDKVSSNKSNPFLSFLYSLVYYPLTFLAEKVWFPIMGLFFGTQKKDNSYHCLAVSGEVWFFGKRNFTSHVIKGFNEDAKYQNVVFLEAFKRDNLKKLDLNKMRQLLQVYPEKIHENGTSQSPIEFLILYEVYKYISNNK